MRKLFVLFAAAAALTTAACNTISGVGRDTAAAASGGAAGLGAGPGGGVTGVAAGAGRAPVSPVRM